jgi:hypothetical protein
VLGSIVGGLVLGLVLVLVVFAGAREPVITGAALISLACGMLTLFALSGRRTDQPQQWALAPAVGLGVVGIALIALTPSDHVLGLLGWVWPPLLGLLVVWSVRGARRSLHNWSRRALLYPALVILGLIALGGAFETVAETTTSNSPSAGRSYLVNGHLLYPELRRLRISNRGAVQRPRRANTKLGVGTERSRSRDSRLHL